MISYFLRVSYRTSYCHYTVVYWYKGIDSAIIWSELSFTATVINWLPSLQQRSDAMVVIDQMLCMYRDIIKSDIIFRKAKSISHISDILYAKLIFCEWRMEQKRCISLKNLGEMWSIMYYTERKQTGFPSGLDLTDIFHTFPNYLFSNYSTAFSLAFVIALWISLIHVKSNLKHLIWKEGTFSVQI